MIDLVAALLLVVPVPGDDDELLIPRIDGEGDQDRAAGMGHREKNEIGGTSQVRRMTFLAALLWLGPYVRADDWPQWRGPSRDGVWHESGILDKFPAEGLKIRWRAPIGLGFSSPVVAQGRVFVTDCALGPKEKRQAKERVRCFEEATGKPLWTHCYDADYPDFAWPPDDDFGGPISTPIVQGGNVYAVGAVGNLFCLDAVKGEVLWKKDLTREYRIKGEFLRCGSPLIEGNLLILQVNGNDPRAGIVAFDKDSGKEVWKALDTHGYFASPLVVEAGGKRQLIVSTFRWVTSLDPATGKIYWQEGFVQSIPTPVLSRNRLLVNGLMFALDPDKPAASVLWPARKTDAFLSDTTTALIHGELVLSHKHPDLLVCLDAKTGKQLWDAKVKSSMHSLTFADDGVFVFTDQGALIRARISAQGYQEISRTALIRPTTPYSKNKNVVYAAPSFANRHVFARNDEELICASLAPEP